MLTFSFVKLVLCDWEGRVFCLKPIRVNNSGRCFLSCIHFFCLISYLVDRGFKSRCLTGRLFPPMLYIVLSIRLPEWFSIALQSFRVAGGERGWAVGSNFVDIRKVYCVASCKGNEMPQNKKSRLERRLEVARRGIEPLLPG